MAIPLAIAALVALEEAAKVTLVVLGGLLVGKGISEMVAADDEADKKENPASTTDACSTCPKDSTPPPAGATPEDEQKLQEQREKKAELEQSCSNHTEKTKVIDHQSRLGGYDQALSDFDELELNNVRDIKTHDYGRGTSTVGKTGEMKDGTKVTVRPDSSEGTPTLEFQPSDQAKQAAKNAGHRPPLVSKIRYR